MAAPSSGSEVSSDSKETRAGRDLAAAIGVGVLLVAIVIGTLAWWHWGFAIFAAIALTLGAWELNRAFQTIGRKPAFVPIAIAIPVTVLLTYWVGVSRSGLGSAAFVVLGGMIVAVVSCLAWRILFGVSGYVLDAAASLFIVGYLLVLGASLMLMLADTRGAARVAIYLLCIVAADTGAYGVGVFFGKHKMAPKISPAKSWEGFGGGVLTAVAIGSVLTYFVLDTSWWVGALLGFCMAFCAALGDLIESAIKRDVGLKDMSHLLPGHGGVMDRIDSMIFAAPVAWSLLYLLVE